MNEIMRLQYLDALGIDQWVANSPLVNARASDFVDFQSEGDSLASENIPIEEKNTIRESAVVHEINSEKQLAESAKPIEPIPESDKNSNKGVSFHLQLQGKQGAYVCLVELTSTGSLDVELQKLLENIMKAVDQLLDTKKTMFMHPEVFKWPMFQRQGAVSHIDHSETAASEALNAFLFSFLKRNQQKTLLVFGENLFNLLDASACDKNKLNVICAPALLSLQHNTDLKKLLWQEILNRLG